MKIKKKKSVSGGEEIQPLVWGACEQGVVIDSERTKVVMNSKAS